MISSEDANAAINAAHKALAEDPELAWIRKSVLIERAYYQGLSQGLMAIAAEDDLRRLMTIAVKELIWSRGGDDTFPSTNVSQAYSDLRGQFDGAPLETKRKNGFEGMFAGLRDTIGQVERHFQKSASTVEEILSINRVAIHYLNLLYDNRPI